MRKGIEKMGSLKTVKKDESTGIHIDRIQVGGVVWFLKDANDNVISHGQYRQMLKQFHFWVDWMNQSTK